MPASGSRCTGGDSLRTARSLPRLAPRHTQRESLNRFFASVPDKALPFGGW